MLPSVSCVGMLLLHWSPVKRCCCYLGSHWWSSWPLTGTVAVLIAVAPVVCILLLVFFFFVCVCKRKEMASLTNFFFILCLEKKSQACSSEQFGRTFSLVLNQAFDSLLELKRLLSLLEFSEELLLLLFGSPQRTLVICHHATAGPYLICVCACQGEGNWWIPNVVLFYPPNCSFNEEYRVWL